MGIKMSRFAPAFVASPTSARTGRRPVTGWISVFRRYAGRGLRIREVMLIFIERRPGRRSRWKIATDRHY